jgi:hypothetical protein
MGNLSDSRVDAFGGREPGLGGGLHRAQRGEVVAGQVQVLVGAERALQPGLAWTLPPRAPANSIRLPPGRAGRCAARGVGLVGEHVEHAAGRGDA